MLQYRLLEHENLTSFWNRFIIHPACFCVRRRKLWSSNGVSAKLERSFVLFARCHPNPACKRYFRSGINGWHCNYGRRSCNSRHCASLISQKKKRGWIEKVPRHKKPTGLFLFKKFDFYQMPFDYPQGEKQIRLQRNQTKLNPAFDCFGTARYSQLCIQRWKMKLYRVLTDAQWKCDLFGCQSLCHELNDFHLAGS